MGPMTGLVADTASSQHSSIAVHCAAEIGSVSVGSGALPALVGVIVIVTGAGVAAARMAKEVRVRRALILCMAEYC